MIKMIGKKYGEIDVIREEGVQLEMKMIVLYTQLYSLEHPECETYGNAVKDEHWFKILDHAGLRKYSDIMDRMRFLIRCDWAKKNVSGWIDVKNGGTGPSSVFYHEMEMVLDSPDGTYFYECPYCGTIMTQRYEDWEPEKIVCCPRCDENRLNYVSQYSAPDEPEFHKVQSYVKWSIFFWSHAWYRKFVAIKNRTYFFLWSIVHQKEAQESRRNVENWMSGAKN